MKSGEYGCMLLLDSEVAKAGWRGAQWRSTDEARTEIGGIVLL